MKLIKQENYEWHLRCAETDKKLWQFAALMFLGAMLSMLIYAIYRTESDIPLKEQIRTLQIEKNVLIETNRQSKCN